MRRPPARWPDVADQPISVPLRRLPRWLDGFAERHGTWTDAADEVRGTWILRAADGSTATVHAPEWLPMMRAPGGGRPLDDVTALAGLRPTFGALLIRRAGYAVARFDGDRLVESKVGSRHIHGRTAAGGWSQQRYARRRENQAAEIVGATADWADRILGSSAARAPSFLVTGGDRPLLTAVRAELGDAAAGVPVGMHLGIGTPDATVVAGLPDRVLAVSIEVSRATG